MLWWVSGNERSQPVKGIVSQRRAVRNKKTIYTYKFTGQGQHQKLISNLLLALLHFYRLVDNIPGSKGSS